MTFAMPQRSPRIRIRRRSPLAVTLAVLVGVVVLVMILAQVWTEVLWDQQVGFFQVLRTEWVTRAILFVLGFLLMAGATGLALRLAYRSRPVYPPSSPEQATLDHYREQIEPLRRLAMAVGPLILGVFAGAAASSQWTDVLLFLNRVPFGRTDPQFGIDLSFFVFTLPVLRFIASFLVATTVLSIIGSLATHYLYGGIRVDLQPALECAAPLRLDQCGCGRPAHPARPGSLPGGRGRRDTARVAIHRTEHADGPYLPGPARRRSVLRRRTCVRTSS